MAIDLASRRIVIVPCRDPVIPGAVPYGDVIVPFVMAATAAAALAQRSDSGKGVHVDASMYEICVQQMRDAIIATQTGPAPQRMGNNDPNWYRQDVWPAEGDDRWIAVSVRDVKEWQCLCELAGGEDIAAWTARHNDYALMALLQSKGIAAGVVQDIEDLMTHDNVLAARNALITLPHHCLGEFSHVRTPVEYSRTKPQPYAAPGMGEHSREIAASLAGLSAQRISELEHLGIFK